VEFSLLDVLVHLFIGAGWYKTKSLTNRLTTDGVPAEIARYLTEDRSLVTSRVVEFIHLREKQRLLQEGGRPCARCDAVFVASEDKPWTALGYCSKLCAAEEGNIAIPQVSETTIAPTLSSTIDVTCPNAHNFKVPVSFVGCMRRCPECGERTVVNRR
jgi:hypothetical protein